MGRYRGCGIADCVQVWEGLTMTSTPVVRRSYSTSPAISSPGRSPRTTTTAQTVAPMTVRQHLNAALQTPIGSAPKPSQNRTATAHTNATAPLRSAPTQTHPGTINSRVALRSDASTPIVLRNWGSRRGTSTQAVVIPPPQPFVPNVARLLRG